MKFGKPDRSYFNILEMKNYSEEGIVFEGELAVKTLRPNGCTTKSISIGSMNLQLTEDITLKSDLIITGSTIDLNGYKLTVEGNLLQTGGTLYINGGELEVAGNYKIENSSGKSTEAYLKMVNEADYVKVGGSFSTYSSYGHKDYLTAGIMEIKGDFTQKYNGNLSGTKYNFNASGTHKVILSGEGLQTVSFNRPGDSKFNILGITKPLETGYSFNCQTPIWSTLEELTEDTQAPTKPTEFQVVSKNYLTVTLSWSASTDNSRISRYIIYRDGVEVGSTSSLSFSDKGLMADTKYTYTIRACDIYDNLSDESDPLSITTESDTLAPSVPNGFEMLSRTDISIGISWKASTDDTGVIGYDVFRDGVFIYTTVETVFVDTGLLPDRNYSYSVRAKDAAGNVSRASSPITIKTLADILAPAAPENLQIVLKTETTITIKWDKSEDNIGVKEYEIFRNGISIGKTSILSYTDKGLEPDTVYTYTVRAIDSGRNVSEPSEPVTTKTEIDIAAPSAPKSLRIESKTESSVKLVWSGSVDNARVEGYKIYKDGVEIGTSSVTSYVDAELTPGTFIYSVAAYDKAGNVSNISNYIMCDNEIPSAPSELQLVSINATTAEIRWTESTDNIGVTGYIIVRQNGTSKSEIGPVKSTSYMDKNLMPEAIYTYYVIAKDGAGNSSVASNFIEVTTSPDTESPAVPTGLKISSKTANSVDLSWIKSSDNVSVVGYEIYRNGNKVGTSLVNGYSDKNLTKDSTYEYRIKAYDSAGNYSEESESIIVTTSLPKAPEGLSAVAGELEVILAWNASNDSEVSHYRIYRASESGTATKIMDNITTTGTRDYNVSANVYYTYQISAIDVYGNEGELSLPVGVTPLEDITPPVLENLNTSRTGDLVRITVAVTDNISASSIAFSYRLNTGAWTEIKDLSVTSERNKKKYISYDWNISGLEDGEYEVKCVSKDSAGNLSNEAITKIYIRNTAPLSPTQVNAFAGQLSADITWSEVKDSYLDKYKIYRRTEDTEFELIYTTKARTYIDNKVLPGVSYTYKVTSVDIYGHESAGTLSDAITVLSDNTPPQVNSFLPLSGEKLKGIVNISALAVDNFKVSNYEFFYSKVDDGEKVWISLGKSTSGTIKWDTVTKGSEGECELKVIVKDSYDNMTEATAIYTIDNTPPEAPFLSASSAELMVSLTWQPVSLFEDFDHYRVYRKGSEQANYVLVTRTEDTIYVDRTAPENKDSYYKITAVDKMGNESLDSNVVKIRPGLDITAPDIDKFEPATGTALRSGSKIIAHAVDNVGIEWYSFEYRQLDENNNPIEGKDWSVIASVYNPGTSNVEIEWDTLAIGSTGDILYPDGNYQVKVSASDEAGNKASQTQIYVLANDPPKAPEKIYVKAAEWQLVVSWSPVIRPDFRYYVLYRKEGRDGVWEKIVNYTTSNMYIDRNRNPYYEYFYRVSVVNDLGRESEPSFDYSIDGQVYDNIDIRALNQTSSPVILEMKPAELSKTNSIISLEVIINDMVGASVLYEYAYVGLDPASQLSGNEVWQNIGEDNLLQTASGNGISSNDKYGQLFVSKYSWDVSTLAEGVYAVRAVTENRGNKKCTVVKKYIVDREAPISPANLIAEDTHTGGELAISWNPISADDISHYELFRAITSGGPYTLVSKSKSLLYRDTGLENGRLYYYVVRAVDNAGNAGNYSGQVSEIPSALSDLTVLDINSIPSVPAYNTINKLKVTSKNLGYAKASGKLDFFYMNNESEWIYIDSTRVELSGSSAKEVLINWIPGSDVSSPVKVKAVITTDKNTEDMDTGNNITENSLALNIPPVALIEAPEWVNSGEAFTLSGAGTVGKLSYDLDGTIVSYIWDMGDGTRKEGSQITHIYKIPGQYSIKLTVKDNNDASVSSSAIIRVNDNRSDLIVDNISWTPENPVEQDVVQINATISNIGKGSSSGFLVGFYIDNQYIGYTRVDNSIGAGESIIVPFTWVGTSGVHVLKVVANDILDNLKEIDKTNNSKSIALTTQQVNFPDVKVTGVTWSPDGINMNNESPFVYRATILNEGTANAERFFVSLYVDGKWIAKQHVNILSPNESLELSFIVKATSGIHDVTIKVDDPAPSLVEIDRDDNYLTVTTPEFIVNYPEIKLEPLSWLPQDTVLTEGTSLTFETKIVNTSTIDITNRFNVDFNVDGKLYKSITIDKLGAGEGYDLWVRWTAQPGEHKVSAVADAARTVTNSVYDVSVTANIPEINLIYPDLNISDVQWSPLSLKYGEPVTYIVRVSNQSVTSIFKDFNVGLYVDGKSVSGKVIKGLRGHSTAIVALTWTPKTTGTHNVKIIIDDSNQLIQEPLAEGDTRIWEREFNIADRLVVETEPNKASQEDDIMAVIYSASDNFIPLEVRARKASRLDTLLGPESGISALYKVQRGTEVIMSGAIVFDYASKIFKSQIPIVSIGTGTYTITIEAGDGVENYSETFNILIVQDTVTTIEVNKDTYLLGETVHISGNISFRDGKPMANEKVVLDLQLEPYLEDAKIGIDDNGKTVMKQWHAQHIRFIETDENGHFEYNYLPSSREAGEWHAVAYAYKQFLGTGAKADFTVWGMSSYPSELSLIASKNSNFSKVITVKNAAEGGNAGLAGISAVLVDMTPNSKVRATIDTSTLAAAIGSGASTNVVVNFNAPLDCADTAQYKIIFTSAEGATTTAYIKLFLRPAVPLPITDPKGIEVGLNPGGSLTRKIKVTNKGLGNMNQIRLEAPSNILWIKPHNLEKNFLAPGEYTYFDVTISPPEATPLGQYQDYVTVTDGKYKAIVTIAAEVSSSNTGSLSFLVTDDTGVRVSNAEVYLVGKDPYIQVKGGQEITYYQNFYGFTDSNGLVTFEDKPIGEYTYTISARARKTLSGTANVMPITDGAMVEVTMENLPVQIEWTVTPTTIKDSYEIKLELTFGANIPKPYFGFVPPWVSIPKQVEDPMIVEATVVNAGLVAITDVTASVLRENDKDTGISIVGGGYIGEIPAHGSVKIQLLIQPGYYNMRYGNRNGIGLPYNGIVLTGNFVSFDEDTGLPVYPPEEVRGSIPFYNPGEKKATVEIKMPSGGVQKIEEIQLPDEQVQEIDYFQNIGNGGNSGTSGSSGESSYEIISLKLDQTATLERQAFNATLKISNGYPEYALQNLSARVVVTDMEGNDVTNKNFVIPTGLNGITGVDGTQALLSGKSMTANWQIIPGDGLGGTDLAGKTYFAKAIISYYVNGRYVETQTQAEEIVIVPQPKIKLHYYVPHNVVANQPFRLGVTAENIGDGIAKNLVIESGQLEIEANKMGLSTEFKILGTSFGNATNNSFTLNLGDVDPHSQVSGYWIVKWVMYEEREGAEPLTGQFSNFKASLRHKDYKGVQLNPLIVGVTTEIIGKDNLFAGEDEEFGGLTLIDIGDTGFPNYLINLKTGLKLPVYVPQNLNVTKQPEPWDNTLKFSVPAPEGDPDAPDTPRYQILLLKDPLTNTNIRSVTRDVYINEDSIIILCEDNVWKDYGNIYIVDEIPVSESKHDGLYEEQMRCFQSSAYTVDFTSGAVIDTVEYSQNIYHIDPATGNTKTEMVYYDVGHLPDEGSLVSVRALVSNSGRSTENGKVEFIAVDTYYGTEIKIGEAYYNNLNQYASTYVYSSWTPEDGGVYKLIARIAGVEGDEKETELVVNHKPYADAGVDFSADVKTGARFDGSRSYDKDGYIKSFVWEFGDGESAYGVCPVHVYQDSGTYNVILTVIDNNNAESISQMQITVNETRPDLRVKEIKLSNEKPEEGQILTVTGAIHNGGYSATDAPFLVCFYVDNQYQDYVRFEETLMPGETKYVSFEWKNTVGNHMLTIVANDMGHPVDEADFDNNQKSRPVDTGVTNFPNLKVIDANWGGSKSGIVSWNETVTLSATIVNDGVADAENFNIAVFADDEFIESFKIDRLSHKAGQNSVTVMAKWKARREGKHTFKFMADGPLPYVVEMDKSDNVKKIESPEIKLLYPDITVTSLNITPNNGILKANQPMVITATVSNAVYASTSEAFNITLYADGLYLDSKECSVLNSGEEKFVSFTWDRPISGTSTITAVADENNRIRELSEDNNTYTYNFDTALSVRLPDLVVESIESTPESGLVKYGDTVITKVKLKNNGVETISESFTTALYVNNKLVGSFNTSNILVSGASTIGTIEWKADLLPTSPAYKLDVYADVYNQLYVADRSKTKASVDLKVGRGLIVNYDTLNEAYTINEKPVLRLKAVSTDEKWKPLSNEDGINALVEIYSGKKDDNEAITGEKIVSELMSFNTVSGKFEYTINPELLGLTEGDYTISVNVYSEMGIKTEYIPIKLVNDYIVSVNTSKETYIVGEPIEIYGTVKSSDGTTPLGNIETTLIIVGEKEWRIDVVTDEEGKFNHTLRMEDGFGGSYSLKAEAKYNAAKKISSSKVFYVEGVLLSIDNWIKVTAGRSVDVPLTITNLGTVPVTGITVSTNFEGNKEGITVEFTDVVPKEIEVGNNIKVNLRITALKSIEPGSRKFNINFVCQEGYSSTVTNEVYAVEAYSNMDLQIGGVMEIDNYGNLRKDRVAASLRPGSTVTQFIRIANTGTAPLTNIQVVAPAKLPWITITTTGTDLVLPISDGLSIRDANSHATISVQITPDEFVQPGQYEDVIKIRCGEKEIDVPVFVYVGPMNVGTTILQVLDTDSIPVDNAKVELIGPMTSAGLQPMVSSVLKGTEGIESNFRFENIAAGTYILKIEAPYHKPFESSFEVQALIDLAPQKVYLEKMPYTLEWSADVIEQAQQTSPDGETYKLELETLINTSSENAGLISNFIGYELYDSDITVNLFEVISVKNTSGIEKIFDVQAELVTNNSSLPEDVLSLIKDSSSNATYNLGDFEPGENKDFRVYVNDNKLYDVVQIEETELPGTYTVSVPEGMTQNRIKGWVDSFNLWGGMEGRTVTSSVYNESNGTYTITMTPDNEGIFAPPAPKVNKFYKDVKFDISIKLTGKAINQYNKEYEVELNIPFRFHFKPYLVFGEDSIPGDEASVRVKAAFNPIYLKDSPLMKTVELSRNFITHLGGRTVDEPEKIGPVLGSFDFSQDAVLDDEVIDANFRLLNPSTYEKIENAEIELIITDSELGENGEIFPWVNILNDKFNIYYNQTIKNADGSIEYLTSDSDSLFINTIAPGQSNDVNFKIQRKTGNSEDNYYGDVYLYINYDFTKGKSNYSGVTKPKIVYIQAPSKIYLSYEFERISDTLYEVTVKATNAGLGSAKGLKLLPPTLRSSENLMIVEGMVEGGGWIQNPSYLKFEEIKPGQTVIGKYRILSSKALDLSQSVSFDVLSQNSSGKVLVTPLTFNKVADRHEFTRLIMELEEMKENVGVLFERTEEDLARAIAESVEYVDDLDEVRKMTAIIDIMNTGFGYIFSSANLLINSRDIAKAYSGFEGGSDIMEYVGKGKINELLQKILKIYNYIDTAKSTIDLFDQIALEIKENLSAKDYGINSELESNILRIEQLINMISNESEFSNLDLDDFETVEVANVIMETKKQAQKILAATKTTTKPASTDPYESEPVMKLLREKMSQKEADRLLSDLKQVHDKAKTNKLRGIIAELIDCIDYLKETIEILQDEKNLVDKIESTISLIQNTVTVCSYTIELQELADKLDTYINNMNTFEGLAKQSLEESIENYLDIQTNTDTQEEQEEQEEEEEKDDEDGKVAILFPGDAEKESEKDMISAYSNTDILSSDILKIAHHGSNTSTRVEFLQVVQPDAAVISTNGRNSGFKEETLPNLRMQLGNTIPETAYEDTPGTVNGTYGEHIYSTDVNGKITVDIVDEEINKTVAKVTLFSVKNGDCILVEADNNKMLIDAGSYPASILPQSRDELFSEIDSITDLKYLVITHPDGDHYNYINKRLSRDNPDLSIERVYIPNVNNADFKDNYQKFIDKLGRYDVRKAQLNEEFTLDNLGTVKFKVIGPVKNYTKSNNTSIVLKMIYEPLQDNENEEPRRLRTITRYTVKNGDEVVEREDVASYLSSNVKIKEISQFMNLELEEYVQFKNTMNYQNWLTNSIDFMTGININDTESIRQRLINYYTQVFADKSMNTMRSITNFDATNDVSEYVGRIMEMMPSDDSARRIFLIDLILDSQNYEVVLKENVIDAYEGYLESDPYLVDLYEEDMNVLKKASETGDMSLLRTISDRLIDEAIITIQKYIDEPSNAPAYYPTDVLLKYFEGLNDQIESISGTPDNPYKGFGKYKNITIFESNGDEVHPEYRDLRTMKDQYVELLKSTSAGYGTLVDRANLNTSKASLYSINALFQPYYTTIGLSPFGSLASLFMSLGYSKAESIMNDAELFIYTSECEDYQIIANDLAKMVQTTGEAYSRELGISESVKNLITNVDEWRKIDPPLPIETVSISIPDVIVKNGAKSASGEAIIILKNTYVGELSVLSDMAIYSGKTKYGSYSSEPTLIKPGETVEIRIPFEVQRSTLVDIAGYRSLITINLSEPDTMSLGDPKGPYTVHFYAGTESQIDALRNTVKVVQPLGRIIKGGEQDESEYVVDEKTEEIRFALASGVSSKVELHLYDKDGNHIGYTFGGIYENNISQSEVVSLKNENDLIIIRNPDNGPYRMVVLLGEGNKEQQYSLEVTEVCNVGAIPDVDVPRLVVSNTKKPEFTVYVFESSHQTGIETVDIENVSIKDINGNEVALASHSFKTVDGADISTILQTGIPAGMAAVARGEFDFGDNLADGIYNGIIRVTVKGNNLNPDFRTYMQRQSVADSVYSWQNVGVENGLINATDYSEYYLDCPITFIINTSVPEVPQVTSIEKYVYNGIVCAEIEGVCQENTYVEAYVDGVLTKEVFVGNDKKFSLKLEILPGTHQAELISRSVFEIRSRTSYITTLTGWDNEGPIIIPVSPKDGEIVETVLAELKFSLIDTLSGVDDSTLMVSVDGEEIINDCYEDLGSGNWSVQSGQLSDGVHDIFISVYDNASNLSTLNWTFEIDTSWLRDTTLSSEVYIIDNEASIISGVLINTTVQEFIDGLQTTNGSTTKVYLNDRITEVTSGTIKNGMVVKVTAADGITTKLFNIELLDKDPPVLTVPADITAEATDKMTFVDIGTAYVEDASECTIVNDAPARYPIGSTLVTWTATDLYGNVSTAISKVLIVDTTCPVLIVPNDITLEATGTATIVDIGSASATDIFEVVISNDAPESYPVGTTIVTWTAKDENGNISTGTQTVTVIEPIKFVYGDLNGDNKVNSLDLGYIKQYLLGMRKNFPAEYGLQAADVNGDGKINSIDFAYMMQYVLGMRRKFPVEED